VTLAEWVNSVAKTVRPPGSEIVYANWGYDALGPLIDCLSTQSWQEHIGSRIFAPLGMDSSDIGNVVPGRPTATGHFLSAVDDGLHAMKPVWPWQLVDTSGSVSSTVEDMGNFLATHLSRGTPLLGAETTGEMQRVHASEGTPTSGMGLGWRVTRSNGQHLICHGGDGAGFTNFMGGYPELGVGTVLTLNRGGAAAARSVIANTVLGMLAGRTETAHRSGEGDWTHFEGAYESTYWNTTADLTTADEQPVVTVNRGLVVNDAGEATRLSPLRGATFAAEGGMFHGFEVALDDQDGRMFAGGVYPFTFKRTGEIVPKEVLTPDDSAALNGHWRGTAVTPLGPLLMEFEVSDASHATVSTPFVRDLALEECEAARGRLSGRFAMTVPTVGDIIVLLRLVVSGGKLRGTVYAWGAFGESEFPAELEKVS
jgi:hypothetical protein